MSERKNILFLTDNENYFWGKFIGTKETHLFVQMDTVKITSELQKKFDVRQCTFQDLDLEQSYKEWYVVYGSTEERGLLYKGYVEDILLKLYLDGAVLIPGFEYFRAHGNKCFQEVLRKGFKNKKINNLWSDIVGRYDEFIPSKYQAFPYVVKTSAGSGSAGVRLVNNLDEMKKTVKRLSKARYYDLNYTFLKDFVYLPILWKFKTWIYKCIGRSQSLKNPGRWFYCNKIIIQQYISDLDSDYKVLYYYGKYYVLNRKNRKNDFRASGSGKFDFPDRIDEIEIVLDYARDCAKEINAPMISLDIARKKNECYLIEFQCLCFGTYTIQYADWNFQYDKSDNKWIRVEESSDPEYETARCIKEFIEKMEGAKKRSYAL